MSHSQTMEFESNFSCASLPSLRLSKIENGDLKEVAQLYKACSEHGFFYLDLREDQSLMYSYGCLREFMKQYFDQPLELKMMDDHKSDNTGYEPVATSAGVLKDLPDYYESFKLSKAHIQDPPVDLSSVVKQNLISVKHFSNRADTVCKTILSHLSDSQNRQGDSRFEKYHRAGFATRTNLTFLKYPVQETTQHGSGHNKHTDIGTLTFLLCEEWGLQALTSEGWRYIEPWPGHAIINVGDSLRFLSNNAFRSVVHQVLPVANLQSEPKYTLCYFLRPEDNVIFKDTKGKLIKAKEWHDLKFDHFRESHDEQDLQAILTGGMETNNQLLKNEIIRS